MKTFVLFCFYLLTHAFQAAAVQDRTFGREQQRMKVYQGEQVLILADSAYVVSMMQAQLLNEKLLALRQAQEVNANLLLTHEALVKKLQTIETKTTRLLHKIQLDHQLVQAQLMALLSQLDQSIAYLKATNEALATNNAALKQQLKTMDQTIKDLRKANRKLAWKNTREKVGIGLFALGLGVLLGST